MASRMVQRWPTWTKVQEFKMTAAGIQYLKLVLISDSRCFRGNPHNRAPAGSSCSPPAVPPPALHPPPHAARHKHGSAAVDVASSTVYPVGSGTHGAGVFSARPSSRRQAGARRSIAAVLSNERNPRIRGGTSTAPYIDRAAPVVADDNNPSLSGGLYQKWHPQRAPPRARASQDFADF